MPFASSQIVGLIEIIAPAETSGFGSLPRNPSDANLSEFWANLAQDGDQKWDTEDWRPEDWRPDDNPPHVECHEAVSVLSADVEQLSQDLSGEFGQFLTRLFDARQRYPVIKSPRQNS